MKKVESRRKIQIGIVILLFFTIFSKTSYLIQRSSIVENAAIASDAEDPQSVTIIANHTFSHIISDIQYYPEFGVGVLLKDQGIQFWSMKHSISLSSSENKTLTSNMAHFIVNPLESEIYATTKNNDFHIFEITSSVEGIRERGNVMKNENDYLAKDVAFHWDCDHAFAVDQYGGINIINIADQNHPEMECEFIPERNGVPYSISSFIMGGINMSYHAQTGIQAHNNSLGIIGLQTGGLALVNLADPCNPIQLGMSEECFTPIDLEFFENLTVCANGLDGFTIYDISDPYRLKQVFSFTQDNIYCRQVQYIPESHQLLVNMENQGIWIYDLSLQDPLLNGNLNISLERSIDIPIKLMEYVDGLLFCKIDNQILEVIDLGFDVDLDGLSDGWERNYWGDLSMESNSDYDNDNLTQKDEFLGQLNPISQDSDNDGLTDWEELNIWLSDPRNSDTDGDGMCDGWETTNHYDPVVYNDFIVNSAGETVEVNGSFPQDGSESAVSKEEMSFWQRINSNFSWQYIGWLVFVVIGCFWAKKSKF